MCFRDDWKKDRPSQMDPEMRRHLGFSTGVYRDLYRSREIGVAIVVVENILLPPVNMADSSIREIQDKGQTLPGGPTNIHV